jgi:hypothetical protein
MLLEKQQANLKAMQLRSKMAFDSDEAQKGLVTVSSVRVKEWWNVQGKKSLCSLWENRRQFH